MSVLGVESGGCGEGWTWATATCDSVARKVGRRRPASRDTTLERLCAVCRSWAALDAALRARVGAIPDASDGIFLYEDQMAHALQAVARHAAQRGAAAVCETGFGAGHSATLFMTIANVTVLSFDEMALPHQRAALEQEQGGGAP